MFLEPCYFPLIILSLSVLFSCSLSLHGGKMAMMYSPRFKYNEKIELPFLEVPVKTRQVQSDWTSLSDILPHDQMHCADWSSPSPQGSGRLGGGTSPVQSQDGGRGWWRGWCVKKLGRQTVPTKQCYKAHIGGFCHPDRILFLDLLHGCLVVTTSVLRKR